MSELQAKAQITLTKLKDGTRGATWHDGAAEPWNYEFPSDIKVGDYYLYTTTGEVYVLSALPTTSKTNWIDKGNIKGNTGRSIRGIQKWYSINDVLPVVDSIDSTGKPISETLRKDWQKEEFTDEEITALLDDEKVYSVDITEYDSAPIYGTSPWLVNKVGSYITLRGLVRFKNVITSDTADVPDEDTIINGGYIKTHSVVANSLNVDHLSTITEACGVLTAGILKSAQVEVDPEEEDEYTFLKEGVYVNLDTGSIKTSYFYSGGNGAGFSGNLECLTGNIGHLQLEDNRLESEAFDLYSKGFRLDGNTGDTIINQGIFNGEKIAVNPNNLLEHPYSFTGYYIDNNQTYFSSVTHQRRQINGENGLTIYNGNLNITPSYKLVNRPLGKGISEREGNIDYFRLEEVYYIKNGDNYIIYDEYNSDNEELDSETYYENELTYILCYKDVKKDGSIAYIELEPEKDDYTEKTQSELYSKVIIDDTEVYTPLTNSQYEELAEKFYSYKTPFYINTVPLSIKGDSIITKATINHNGINWKINNTEMLKLDQFKLFTRRLESYKIDIPTEDTNNTSYSWVNRQGKLTLMIY